MADKKVQEQEVSKKSASTASNGRPEQQKKKNKKNAPDRPQPAWLFPPDEENPVLNPMTKPEKQVQKETKERLEAIDFLNHKAVSAPMKDAPPSELLSLVGAFLTSYGFNSTCRVFTSEWEAKGKILDAYKAEDVGKKLPKDTPNLLKIYKKWRLEQGPAQPAKSSSGSEDVEDDGPSDTQPGKSKDEPMDDLSSSSSSSDSEDAMSLDGEPNGKIVKGKQARLTGVNGVKKTASSKRKSKDSDDNSETDSSDDDLELKTESMNLGAKPGHNMNGKVSMKSDDSSISSSSDSASDGGKGHGMPLKKTKMGAKDHMPKKSLKRKASDGVPTSEVTQDAGNPKTKILAPSAEPPSQKPKEDAPRDQAEKDETRPKKKKKVPNDATNAETAQVGNGVTVNGTKKAAGGTEKTERKEKPAKKAKKQPPSAPSQEAFAAPSKEEAEKPPKRAKKEPLPASSEETLPAPSKDESEKPKREKKKPNAPFQRISADTTIDPRYASNAYVPNDYSERAHQDLSITKGKGFTKEKNKKKRGS